MFAQGITDFRTHVFDYLPDCNTKCKPMPFFQRFNESAPGRRQNLIYRVAHHLGEYEQAQAGQQFIWNYMMDMNGARYCSPAVNT